jgi:hypothetical protein
MFFLGFILVFSISLAVFFNTFYWSEWQARPLFVGSDLPAHTRFIIKFAQEQSFPAYSAWYFLVYALSGFSESFKVLAGVSIVLLSLLVSTKYTLTYQILSQSKSSSVLVALVSIGLIVVMPLMSYYSCSGLPEGSVCVDSFHFYLGNVSPNQWHNSTLILAMPVNLFLFYFTVKNIHSQSGLMFLWMGLIGFLAALCKPNYAFGFLPVICGTILWLSLKNKQFFAGIYRCVLVGLPTSLVLAYQWYSTFVSAGGVFQGGTTIFAPFMVWGAYSPHIALSLLLSISFPLLVLLLFIKKVDLSLTLSWLVFIVAAMVTSLFAEAPSWQSGNFFWGAIASNYILFVFSMLFLLKQPNSWKTQCSYFLFALHVLSGSVFLAWWFIGFKSLLF